MRKFILNPYNPSVLFVGHMQTVQTKIKRRTMRRLIRVSTVCLQNGLSKTKYKCKIPPSNSEKGNGLVQLITVTVVNSIRLKWVKNVHIKLQHLMYPMKLEDLYSIYYGLNFRLPAHSVHESSSSGTVEECLLD